MIQVDEAWQRLDMLDTRVLLTWGPGEAEWLIQQNRDATLLVSDSSKASIVVCQKLHLSTGQVSRVFDLTRDHLSHYDPGRARPQLRTQYCAVEPGRTIAAVRDLNRGTFTD